MPSRSLPALIIAALVAIAGIVLVAARGGILAWAGLAAGLMLFLKIYLRPSPKDVALSIGIAVIWALTWGATIYYVLSTWESGEVVELAIDTPNGTHTARVWVLDTDTSPVVIYDAEPEIAAALMSGKPVKFTRHGAVSVRRPEAVPAEKMPQEDLSTIYKLMDEKYGRRNVATDVYYSMLGRLRDRELMIVRVTPTDATLAP